MTDALLLVLLFRSDGGGGFFSSKGVVGGPGSWYLGASARGPFVKFEGDGCSGRRVRSF